MNNQINNLKSQKGSLQKEFAVIQNGMKENNLNVTMVNTLRKFIKDGELFIESYNKAKENLVTRIGAVRSAIGMNTNTRNLNAKSLSALKQYYDNIYSKYGAKTKKVTKIKQLLQISRRLGMQNSVKNDQLLNASNNQLNSINRTLTSNIAKKRSEIKTTKNAVLAVGKAINKAAI